MVVYLILLHEIEDKYILRNLVELYQELEQTVVCDLGDWAV